jgi:hypothetical protein
MVGPQERDLSSNENTRTPPAVGRAVFKVEGKTEVVDFSTFTELGEKEDNLTWVHFPTDLEIVSLEYSGGTVKHQAG